MTVSFQLHSDVLFNRMLSATLLLVLLGGEPLFLDLLFSTFSNEQDVEMCLPDRIQLSEEAVCKAQSSAVFIPLPYLM